MKIRNFLMAATLCVLAAGCTELAEYKQKYDNLQEQVGKMGERLSALETIVAAMQAGDYIIAVEPVKDGDRNGYKLTFNKYGEVTVYDGADGKDGAAGKDGDAMFQKVEVGDDAVVFTMTDGTSFSIPRYAADHLNLPNNIIMLSEEFEDVIKKDTIIFNIIANPSDFVITKENLSVLALHDIYTKYNSVYDQQTGKAVEDPFDPTAHCDLTVVDCIKADEFEGAYRVAVAVGGEGNFYDDAKVFLLYGDKDHAGKQRYVCTNTSANVHVIPWIEEGLTADFPQQTLYGLDLEKRCKSEKMKPVLGGLWSSKYKNEGGKRKIYDRTKLSSFKCASDDMSASCTIVDSLFQKYGVICIDPIEESGFWKSVLDDFNSGKILYTNIPDAGIMVSRGNESKILPINPRIYIENTYEREFTKTVAEITAMKKKMSIDLTEDYEKCGWDKMVYSENFTIQHSSSDLHLMSGFATGTRVLDLYFVGKLTPEEPCAAFDIEYLEMCGEDPDGDKISLKVTGNQTCYHVAFMFEKVIINIVE